MTAVRNPPKTFQSLKPCTQVIYILALKYLDKGYFRARVYTLNPKPYTIWAHRPLNPKPSALMVPLRNPRKALIGTLKEEIVNPNSIDPAKKTLWYPFKGTLIFRRLLTKGQARGGVQDAVGAGIQVLSGAGGIPTLHFLNGPRTQIVGFLGTQNHS